MKGRETKLCPTCWNDMRWSKDGYVCPRHGLVAATPDPRPLRTTSSPRRLRVRTSPTPRQPNQTDRLIEMREQIVTRNQAGEALRTIAEDLWQELGYASADICAAKISRFLTRRGISAAPRRAGPPPGTRAGQRFTPERLSELQAALDAGESVWAFAGAHWQAWGFTSRSSCDSLLRKWLRTKVAA